MDLTGLSGLVDHSQGGALGSLINRVGVPLDDALAETKTQYGELRKAGAILSANPVGVVLSELIFPRPFGDGSLKAAIKREGYIGAGVDP
jgi:hypothetical protein|tara:strand:- start:378 stop:647 length:270 start_codon:yes stop_codon:yes gene_type:complete